MSLRIYPAPVLCLAPLCPWMCCCLCRTLCFSRPMCGQQFGIVWVEPHGQDSRTSVQALAQADSGCGCRTSREAALLCWEAAPFGHLLARHVSRGRNLRRLGQQDARHCHLAQPRRVFQRLPQHRFSPFSVSFPAGLWSCPPAPPAWGFTPATPRGPCSGFSPVLVGAGVPGTQNGQGFPDMVLMLMKLLPGGIWLYYF